MILFGRKAHHLGLKEVNTEKCEGCGHQKIVVSVFQKYFHLLWLPMFPIKKEGASQCLSCRKVMVEAKFNRVLKSNVKVLKKSNSTPLWTFSGIFLLLVIILLKELFK